MRSPEPGWFGDGKAETMRCWYSMTVRLTGHASPLAIRDREKITGTAWSGPSRTGLPLAAPRNYRAQLRRPRSKRLPEADSWTSYFKSAWRRVVREQSIQGSIARGRHGRARVVGGSRGSAA
jgi:hypothetical protein